MWDKFIVTEPKVSLNCFVSFLSLAFPSKCLADDLIVLNAFLPTLQWPPMCKRPLSPLSLCSCILLTFLFFSCSYPPFSQKSRKTLLTCRSEFVSFLQNALYFRWTLEWSLHPLSAASHTGPGHIGLSSSEPNDGRCHYKLFYLCMNNSSNKMNSLQSRPLLWLFLCLECFLLELLPGLNFNGFSSKRPFLNTPSKGLIAHSIPSPSFHSLGGFCHCSFLRALCIISFLPSPECWLYKARNTSLTVSPPSKRQSWT